MGSLKEHDGGNLGITIYPYIWFVAVSDYAMLFRLLPMDAGRTELELTWLVRKDAVAGVDYKVERVTWLWKVTTEQDCTIIQNNQKGVNSRRYQPGPYSKAEQGVANFTKWYLEQITPRRSRNQNDCV